MISKLFNALKRTRTSIADSFNILQKNKISTKTLDILESTLISADIGVDTTSEIINLIEKKSGDNYVHSVKDYMLSILNSNILDNQKFFNIFLKYALSSGNMKVKFKCTG